MADRNWWKVGPGADLLRYVDVGKLTYEQVATEASKLLGKPITAKNARDAHWRIKNPTYSRGGAVPRKTTRGSSRGSSLIPADLLRAVDAAANVLDATVRVRIQELEAANKELQADLVAAERERDAARRAEKDAREQLDAVEKRLTGSRLRRAGAVHGD